MTQKEGLSKARKILNQRILGKGGISKHLISNISSFILKTKEYNLK